MLDVVMLFLGIQLKHTKLPGFPGVSVHEEGEPRNFTSSRSRTEILSRATLSASHRLDL